MSDLPGMKHSHDDSTSPHPKCHNTEQSSVPHLSLSEEGLGLLKASLRYFLNHVNEDDCLDAIYLVLQLLLPSRIERGQTKPIVDKEVFRTNVSREKQAFYDIVRRAAKEDASEEDLQAVVALEVFWTNLSSPRLCGCDAALPIGPINTLYIQRAGNLPIELLLRIIRTVISKEDLCQLRSVNSTFNELATPALFKNITVSNNYKSADRLWTVLHTPHIAQHVQSLTYVEEPIWKPDLPYRRPVRKCLEAAFALLHRAPVLKTLALCFMPSFLDFDGFGGRIDCEIYTHLWDIIAALGSNQNPLPQLQSLTINRWIRGSKWNSLYDAVPFAHLMLSLRHLSFSVPNGDSWDSHELFWKPVVVRCVLQQAIGLESLAISGIEGLKNNECLDVSELATYPGLAALSLTNILWEDGEIGHEGIVKPPAVEDFIARHRNTLKTLKLHNCVIRISPGRTTPFCYWADVYDQLAKALTKLVELEVEFQVDGFRTQYVYLTPRSSYCSPVESMDGTEQDGLSLEKFKAVAKN